MKKNGIRGYVVLGILFVIFTVIAFVIPFNRSFGFWCAYVFGVIAIALQIYVFKISFKNGEDAKSRFYGFPIAKIGVIYCAVQLISSLFAMVLYKFVPSFPNWIFIIINVVILGVAAIGCITAETMRDEIANQDVQLKKNVSVMRNLQSIISSLSGPCEDIEVKKIIDNLSEELRYSDPVSCDASREIENNMIELAQEMQKAFTDGNVNDIKIICSKIKGLLAERNRICKVSK